MPIHPDRLMRGATPSLPAPGARRPTAGQWIAGLGVVGALCASGPLWAQNDASAALIEQGNYWQGMGRADLAEESWRKLLRVDPNSADALYGMSQVELARSKPDAAREWIGRLRTAHPTDARLARFQQGAQQAGGPQTDLQRARAAAQAGRTAEAIQLYRAIFDNRPPPEPLAVEYYQLLGGTPQGWDEGRRGLEQLVKDKPDNLNYRLALAQLQTYREPSRREGIRTLAELAKRPSVGTAARASWRQALIWLDARAPDAPLYEAYLDGQSDPAVTARLESLTKPDTAATPVSPAAQPLGEGYRALDRGDTTTAEARFQQALRVQPGDSEALGGMGLIRLRQERFAQAQDYLEQASRTGARKWASALQSATYWNLVGQANTARDRNDLPAAQALLERAVRLDAREPVGQITLADLRAAQGELPAAEQGYKRVLDAKPNDAQALRGLINVYTRQGRAEEALALSQKLTPEQAAQIGGLQNVRVEQIRAVARQQNERGDAAGAQRTLEDAMLANPDSPWLRLDLANIYRRQGLMPQARGVMDGLLMSQPDMPDALYASALLASDAGDPVAGLQYLEKVPAAARTRDMTQLQRKLWAQGQTQQAIALAKQGQPAVARNVLQQTEATLGRDMPAEMWGDLATAYAEIGDAPRALAMSRQLLSRGPNPSIGDRLLYASILMKTKQDVELTAVLRQLQATQMTAAQRSDFDNLRTAWSLRQADALREMGNLEAAYNALAPVLAERPNDPGVMAALARLYSAARDERQALALYQRILQRSPTDLDTLLAAAASASALKEHGDAEAYVLAALKQAPDQSRTLAAAGRVYRNAGDNGRAEQYLRAAVAAETRVASGQARTPVPGAAPAPAANPFAGMTGGAPSAAMVLGGAAMQPVSLPNQAAYPAAYPVATQPAPATYGKVNVPAGTAGLPWADTSARAPTQVAGGTAARRNAAATNRSTPATATPAVAATPFSPQPAAAPGTLAGGYPLPVPGSNSEPFPASAASGISGDSNWNGALRNASQPVSPLQSELQALEVDRSPTITAGTVYRNRAGESGLSRLTDLQVPVQARLPVGEGKMVVSATPTVIDAGKLSGDYATRSRFGEGPLGGLADSVLNTTAPGSQNASGVGLAVGYEGKNLNASVGTTPLGFQETNVIGSVSYGGAVTDTLSLKGELSRRPITDSLLSFAGTKDPLTGQKWGGVVANGARMDVTRDDGTYGLYGYGSYGVLTGLNVADNNRAEVGGGMYMHILRGTGSNLTAGMNIGLMHYDKNLSSFTYGHGGYFSPQRYVSVAFPVDWSGRANRLSWRVNASLGVQSFTQNDSPYFPTDAVRQNVSYAAAGEAQRLNLTGPGYTGMYAGSTETGLAYNFAGVLEYQLAPQLYLGGALGLNNAQNYRQLTGSIYLRYLFGGSSILGNASATPGLSPFNSPYTPLL
ncbi:cellulose biosynthesis protein BcsC [Variovorax arabinosiphilus]|uniref:cellulose biosynthesis protein BcsC n=1 Tax=Variovorax arabinosiphilus TaxID=3053498 RepID=UPI0025768C2E|nr:MULTISPECIES: cellulose biosynthesis protein BcsC [unclassified Variovorax]MDM0123174.1 cellulose synthase subunit BcsC-related outer membrane protein [Variovorax sp. J2L1-78]MDM0131830.1 cellulose synthase subunit BcsC-related outer membrane protein [Variovorax sp. J2L1-63]MDM0235937.1 cellulose synthase subunit BcsC-related outer membrane protein [Variovorax sp. J2R1-6]